MHCGTELETLVGYREKRCALYVESGLAFVESRRCLNQWARIESQEGGGGVRRIRYL